jgi:hypothetical protein
MQVETQKRFIEIKLDRPDQHMLYALADTRAPYIWEFALAVHPPTQVCCFGNSRCVGTALAGAEIEIEFWEFALARHIHAKLGIRAGMSTSAGNLGIRAGASTYARSRSLRVS